MMPSMTCPNILNLPASPSASDFYTQCLFPWQCVWRDLQVIVDETDGAHPNGAEQHQSDINLIEVSQ